MYAYLLLTLLLAALFPAYALLVHTLRASNRYFARQAALEVYVGAHVDVTRCSACRGPVLARAAHTCPATDEARKPVTDKAQFLLAHLVVDERARVHRPLRGGAFAAGWN